MPSSLDRTDRALLAALQDNARLCLGAGAALWLVSRSTTRPRTSDPLMDACALACVVAAAVAARAAEPPRVLVIEWVEPPFLAGHWVPDLVVRAGGDEHVRRRR